MEWDLFELPARNGAAPAQVRCSNAQWWDAAVSELTSTLVAYVRGNVHGHHTDLVNAASSSYRLTRARP